MKWVLTAAVVAGVVSGAEKEELEGAHHAKKGTRQISFDSFPREHFPALRPVVDVEAGKKQLHKATAKDVSPPEYHCRDPEWELRGEWCFNEEKVSAQYRCPVDFVPLNETGLPVLPGQRPVTCRKAVAPILVCDQGQLIHGQCIEKEKTEPLIKCPPRTEQRSDGLCVREEDIPLVPVCPPGSHKVKHDCVIIETEAPSFVCPPDSIQEGKKCKREHAVIVEKGYVKIKEPQFKAVQTKHKKRMLYAHADDWVVADEVSSESESVTGLTEAGTYRPEEFLNREGDFIWEEVAPLGGMESEEMSGMGGEVVDGEAGEKLEGLHKEKVAVPMMKFEKVNVKVPVQKVKEIKVKEIKEKPAPVIVPKQMTVVKVQVTPAHRVCEHGEDNGKVCIKQVEVAPILKCPVGESHMGRCVREIIERPLLKCAEFDQRLVCPKGDKDECVCLAEVKVPARPECDVGRPMDNVCIVEARPKPYCPIGFHLIHGGQICIKKEQEEAICTFNVTYICEDCDVKKKGGKW